MVQRLKAPFENETTHIVIGASIGVASATRSSDPGELTRRADIALYHAKAAGRNTYDALFGEHMDELLRRRRALKNSLRLAIETRPQIETIYQPVFTARSGVLCSLETLARLNHPNLGQISPNLIIPLAEDIKIISKIGAVVLDVASSKRLLRD